VLTQRTPDACQKLQILGGRPAADDLLSPHGVAKGKTTCPCLTPVPRRGPAPGSVRASMPDGKFINLIGIRISLRCDGPGLSPMLSSVGLESPNKDVYGMTTNVSILDNRSAVFSREVTRVTWSLVAEARARLRLRRYRRLVPNSACGREPPSTRGKQQTAGPGLSRTGRRRRSARLRRESGVKPTSMTLRRAPRFEERKP
jgi:hypothetical protein